MSKIGDKEEKRRFLCGFLFGGLVILILTPAIEWFVSFTPYQQFSPLMPGFWGSLCIWLMLVQWLFAKDRGNNLQIRRKGFLFGGAIVIITIIVATALFLISGQDPSASGALGLASSFAVLAGIITILSYKISKSIK